MSVLAAFAALTVAVFPALPATVPAQTGTADLCSALTAEGVDRLGPVLERLDQTGLVGLPGADGLVADRARAALNCGSAPTVSGDQLNLTLCANLNLDAIRSLLIAQGGEGVAAQVTPELIAEGRLALNCDGVVTTTPPVTPSATPDPVRAPFANCDLVRDAGFTEGILAEDPLFQPGLDLDGDGVGCEPNDAVGNGTTGGQVTVVPSDAPETGDGSTVSSAPFALRMALAVLMLNLLAMHLGDVVRRARRW